jgi:single-strand DNA-binding protein
MYSSTFLVGRLGKDMEIRSTQSGEQVATLNVATSRSWKDQQSGEWKEKVFWHTVVTFQQNLIKSLDGRAKKGARVLVEGEIEYRKWRKEGETTDREQAEIRVGPQNVIRLLDAPSTEQNAEP